MKESRFRMHANEQAPILTDRNLYVLTIYRQLSHGEREVTQEALAARVGCNATSVRHHLERLVFAGMLPPSVLDHRLGCFHRTEAIEERMEALARDPERIRELARQIREDRERTKSKRPVRNRRAEREGRASD